VGKTYTLYFIRFRLTAILCGFLAVFSIVSDASADTQMAVIGDAGRTTPSSRLVRESIAKSGIQRLVLPGDNLYSGSYQSVWNPWISARLSFDVVAIGNHNGGYRQETAFFSMPSEYYAKVIDGARFLVLNSDNESTAAAQANWLNTELRSAREPLVFVVYHHPSYTISTFHNWEEKAVFQRALRPVIWANRAKITALLVGHDHVATMLNSIRKAWASVHYVSDAFATVLMKNYTIKQLLLADFDDKLRELKLPSGRNASTKAFDNLTNSVYIGSVANKIISHCPGISESAAKIILTQTTPGNLANMQLSDIKKLKKGKTSLGKTAEKLYAFINNKQ
jgi:hypothetical protein